MSYNRHTHLHLLFNSNKFTTPYHTAYLSSSFSQGGLINFEKRRRVGVAP